MSDLFEAIQERLADQRMEEDLTRMIIGMLVDHVGGKFQFRMEEAKEMDGGFSMEYDGATDMVTVTAMSRKDMEKQKETETSH